jgi:hypothetical protein
MNAASLKRFGRKTASNDIRNEQKAPNGVVSATCENPFESSINSIDCFVFGIGRARYPYSNLLAASFSSQIARYHLSNVIDSKPRLLR